MTTEKDIYVVVKIQPSGNFSIDEVSTIESSVYTKLPHWDCSQRPIPPGKTIESDHGIEHDQPVVIKYNGSNIHVNDKWDKYLHDKIAFKFNQHHDLVDVKFTGTSGGLADKINNFTSCFVFLGSDPNCLPTTVIPEPIKIKFPNYCTMLINQQWVTFCS